MIDWFHDFKKSSAFILEVIERAANKGDLAKFVHEALG